ncbi:MAG: TRAP transporter small permease [Firmicutes bacterium]|nr:TRAP transporter small permease [Bacillota bacterium]
MNTLKKCDKAITAFENWLATIMFVAMVIVVIAIVMCRYVLNIQFVMGEEIARYLMIWCGYAGAAMAFRNHAHVGVVVFADMMPASWQPVILKIRHILSSVIVAMLFVFAYLCILKYIDSGQLTTATKIPTALVYSIIPISMLLGIVHNIVDVVNDFRKKGEVTEA